MTNGITVVVADDHSLFRTGVVQSLMLDGRITVVGEAASGPEAIEMVKQHRPNIILLDISMPGGGTEQIRNLLELPAPPHVVMLTVSQQDDDIVRALESGAVGYITKGITAPELAAAVCCIAAGDSFVSPNLARRVVAGMKSRTLGVEKLTQEEQRVLRLVATGMSNREVGRHIGVQEKAVKYRMTRIMRKLSVKNRVEAVLVARSHWSSDPIK